MAWSERCIEVLKEEWAEGKSAAQIARILKAQCGFPVSRNAVIGKVHRLGLSGHTTPVKPHYRIRVEGKIYYSVPRHAAFYGGGYPVASADKVYTPPCWRVRRIAEFVFDKKTNSEIFGPLLDDVQVEFNEAIANERIRLAQWIVVRGYISFALTVLAWFTASFFEKAKTVSRIIKGG